MANSLDAIGVREDGGIELAGRGIEVGAASLAFVHVSDADQRHAPQ
jgi:hypothetical protein